MADDDDESQIAEFVDAIQEVQRCIVGALAVDSRVSADTVHDGSSVREWLEALRFDIDSFLSLGPGASAPARAEVNRGAIFRLHES